MMNRTGIFSLKEKEKYTGSNYCNYRYCNSHNNKQAIALLGPRKWHSVLYSTLLFIQKSKNSLQATELSEIIYQGSASKCISAHYVSHFTFLSLWHAITICTAAMSYAIFKNLWWFYWQAMLRYSSATSSCFLLRMSWILPGSLLRQSQLAVETCWWIDIIQLAFWRTLVAIFSLLQILLVVVIITYRKKACW